MHKTILFLDFDGVLHPFPMGVDDQHFSQVNYLWDILDNNPQLDVVITSTWRENKSLEQLMSLLNPPAKYKSRFIGMTPVLEDEHNYVPGIRQTEIEAYLTHNNMHSCSYIVLDDIEEYFHKNYKNLYLVDGVQGLTQDDVEMLPIWLKNLTPQPKVLK